MEAANLSALQQANLCYLLAIRDTANRNKAEASLSFVLDKQELDAIASLSWQEVFAFVVSSGEQGLFHPRMNLASLLPLPPQLVGMALGARRIDRRGARAPGS